MKREKDAPKIPSLPPLGIPLNLLGPVFTDPMGSYTGRFIDRSEEPVQDADDL